MADGDRYSNLDEMTAFGFLANALGGGGDRGQSFPQSDAEDMSRGASFIPGEVTLARREGKKVNFVTNCTRNCWYWQFEDGSRIYYYEPAVYERIGRENHGEDWTRESGEPAGPCPSCGNPHTSGGRIAAEEVAST